MNVQIVALEAMRVARTHAIGSSPETLAYTKMVKWAKAGQILEGARLFGFDNPSPEANKSEYGYEVWMTVAESVKPAEDITLRDFEGGLYAVAEVIGVENIGQAWQGLVQWQKSSEYQKGQHQWLEENIDSLDAPPEKLHLKLYLPVAK